jgi:FixJ family two-component response regulator
MNAQEALASRLTNISSVVETGRSAMALQHVPGRPMITKSKAILIVDDNPSMLNGMKRLLREHGFNVELFDSGVALLGADFDDAFCVILDIDLNNQSGIDLRRQLVDRGVELPVIFITGNDSEANRSAAIESGCIAYLTKPFSANSLIEPVEKARAASS